MTTCKNCSQMLTKSKSMDVAKSPKSSKNYTKSFEDNISPSKNVHSSSRGKHLRTSTPLKKNNSDQDNKTIETNSSQELSQLKENECKFMLNLLKNPDSDDLDLNSQDKKLILKIANKNKKLILPLDTTQINTQQLMELNVDIATRNLQQSCSQVDTSNEMVKTIDSDEVLVVTSSESNQLKDSKPNNKREEHFDKMENSKYCTIDLDQENEILKETQDSILSKQNHESSKLQDQDSEIISFRSMCEEMLKIKSLIDTDKVTINNRVVYFKQVSADVINVVSYADYASSINKVKSTFGSTYTNNCYDIPKPLTSKGCHLKRKMCNSSTKSSDEMSQVECVSQNKRSKFNAPHDTLEVHSKLNSNSILKKPNVLNTVNYFVVTSSEDEDECVIINNEFQKDQNSVKKCAPKMLIDESVEAKKRLKEIKPIFKCSPDGQIHKDMLNFISKNSGKTNKYD